MMTTKEALRLARERYGDAAVVFTVCSTYGVDGSSDLNYAVTTLCGPGPFFGSTWEEALRAAGAMEAAQQEAVAQ